MSKTVYNPYLPAWEYVPDGEPHVFGDRVWVYGSHDRPGGTSYCMEDYVGWSAPVDDLSAWECSGVIWRKAQDPRYEPGDTGMAAPDVTCGPDGRYYLYYFTDFSRLGVAVSPQPGGPFEFWGFVGDADGNLLDTGMCFDPAILSDASGNWLYYGFDSSYFVGEKAAAVSGGFVVELEDDMKTIKGEPHRVLPGKLDAAGTPFEGHAFFEASSIRHIGDTYYLVYSSEQGHELCYATSDRPDEGFAYRGVIISNADVGYRGNSEPTNYMANNHGGMACIAGQWYIFYHRHTHDRQYSRQTCAEPIEILPDGTIPQVEVTSCGLNRGPIPAMGTLPAYIICNLRGPEGVLHISSHVHRRPSDPYLVQEGSATGPVTVLTNVQGGASCAIKYLGFSGNERMATLVCRGDFAGTATLWVFEKDKRDEAAAVATVDLALPGDRAWHNAEARLASVVGTRGLAVTFEGIGALDLKEIRIA